MGSRIVLLTTVDVRDTLDLVTSPASWQPLTVTEATALGWTLGPYIFAKATRAFDEWRMVTNDQRAYLGLTLKWMNEPCSAVWKKIGKLPALGNGLEQFDIWTSRWGSSRWIGSGCWSLAWSAAL